MPHLELVSLAALQPIADIGDLIREVHFPESGIISLLSRVDGTLVENGTIGCEGMSGFCLALGVDWTTSLILGEVPGTSWRIGTDTFVQLLQTMPALELLLRRYAVYFQAQVAQSLTCNSLHGMEQRCARWLLMTHDRIEGDEFILTQEVLAQMLAVHRPAVSVAAGALQDAGLISYSRGRMRIRDRAGLERASCDCYRIVSGHRDRLLGEFGG